MTVQANSLAIANNLVSICGNMPATMLTACNQPVTPGVQTVTPQSINGITPGAQLQVDVTNPETITVTSVSGPSFTATFALSHGPGPWSIGNGGNLVQLAKLGAMQDPTDVAPYISVSGRRRKLARFSSGWKVNSTPVFVIETGADLGTPQSPVNSTAVEQYILNAADTLTGFFVAHITLGNVPGVYVTLVDMDDDFGYSQFMNGRIYRTHHCYVQAIQQFNVLVGQ